MMIREKIGQLSQYNANLFIDTDAVVTGEMKGPGLGKRCSFMDRKDNR